MKTTETKILKSNYIIHMNVIPIESMIVVEQNPGQLSGGIEVGPVDSGPPVARVEDEGLERWVQ